MEDPRLSRMYAKLFTRSFFKRRERFWEWTRQHRSSLLALLAFSVFLGLIAGYVAHLHGRFRQIKTELRAMGSPQVELPPMPGGQEAVVLQRTMLAGSTTPEFLSATLLPGRGLNVFQIMVAIPGHSPIPLLQAPSLENAAKLMSGMDTDADGIQSLLLGSPIEAPWAGFVSGTRNERPGAVVTVWHGRSLVLPRNAVLEDTPISQGGLLLKAEADSVKQNIMPDGGTVQGSFSASNFADRWPSQTSVSVAALLSSHTFELKIVARNEGKEPAPFGIGWRPQLVFPSGARSGVRLRLPAGAREEMSGGRATGRLLDVADTPMDFTDRAGRLLRNLEIDDTFVDLHSGFLDNGPVVEVRDTRSGVGVRLTAMSPQIRAIHVQSSTSDNRITLGFQTNLDDPFSHVWNKDDGGSINVLQPGQTLQWRLRLEVFALSNSATPAL